MSYCYILKGEKDFYYCGITRDIVRRLQQHNTGKSKSTRVHLPLIIKFLQEYNDMKEARRKEIIIKNQGVKKWYQKNILFGNHKNMVCTELISGKKI